MAVRITKAAPKVDHKKHLTRVPVAKRGDTAGLILNGSDAFPEDSFEGIYFAGGSMSGIAPILEPFFKPGTLYALASQNNTLMQCIEAMEVNIDGTGHSFVLRPGITADDETEKQMLEDFFREPYPGMTMVGIRRQLRRDLEATGNGYLQILRDIDGNVAAINWLDAMYMRLIRVDEPVQATKVITRNGKQVQVQIYVRERRFVQMINGKRIYFREFGASRQVNAKNGAWVKDGDGTLITEYGSEVLHFVVNREPKTPYGAPRWLNEMPSVLGSRKAEEFNLEYFDAGGLPPVLVLVQGGYLGDTVKEELKQHLGGKGNAKHRAAVVEAVSSSGSMDAAGTVKVTVERFGQERSTDAMFMNYDKNTGEHVREAFRLPPLFVGKAQDYNFATAYTGYMVAEAQVFAPERTEFDDAINASIVRALGAKTYTFRSTPLTLTDVQNQLKALSLVGNLLIDGPETVKKLNEITGLDMRYSQVKSPVALGSGLVPPKATPEGTAAAASNAVGDRTTQVNETLNATGGGASASAGTPKPRGSGSSVPTYDTQKLRKAEDITRVLNLASDFAIILGLETGPDVRDRERVRKEVSELSKEDAKIFHEVLAAKSLSATGHDLEGVAELCGCAVTL